MLDECCFNVHSACVLWLRISGYRLKICQNLSLLIKTRCVLQTEFDYDLEEHYTMGCSSVKLKRNGGDFNSNGTKCNASVLDSTSLSIGQTAAIKNNWRKLTPYLPLIGKNTYLG